MRKVLYAIYASLLSFFVPALAMAEEAAAPAGGHNQLVGLAVGLCMGIAVLGGALGQGRAAAAALEGIGRNPGAAGKIQGPMIIGLALMESLVLFAMLIAYLLYSKV
ncbi:MAG: ATP synthase F0 subunit C [Deltaproteobacteria bacterium]|nr:ATP synthase F0 subunit C [Deltaproteobacteria bacterium]